MSTTVVHKFGGACLAKPYTVQIAVDVLSKHVADTTVVTVSAAAGVTNVIRNLLANLFDNKNALNYAISQIDALHLPFIKKFPALEELNNHLTSELKRTMKRAKKAKVITDQQRESVLVLGELFMAVTFANFLGWLDLDAEVRTPEDLGLEVGGLPGRAHIDFGKDLSHLAQVIRAVRGIVVVPGYYGVDKTGQILTFGRSGTDYTATALGSILEADRVVVWKEVAGFMTADPKLIPTAKVVESLDYSEANELAHFGAQCLHPRAVTAVKRKNIPVEVRDMFGDGRTLIHSETTEGNPITVKSVTYLQNLSLLKTYLTTGSRQSGVLHNLTSRLAENSVLVYGMATSSVCITLLVTKEDSRKILPLFRQERLYVEEMEEVDGVSLVCVVGKGLGASSQTKSKVFQVVANAGIEVDLISAGGSSNSLQFTVNDPDLARCLQVIHDAFF